MEIKAKLLVKNDTATFGESGFRKREFVVEFAENPEYPEFVKFELIQDKCDLLDGFDIGQEMKVAFNLKVRKWTNPKGEDVYFNSLQAWRLESVSGSSDTGTKEPEWLNENSKDSEDTPF